MKRILRLAKEAIWIFLGQIITFIAVLLLVRILTEYLTPAQYGELALGLTISGMINATVMGVISNSIVRFYPIAIEKNDFSNYQQSVIKLTKYATIFTISTGILISAIFLMVGMHKWIGLVIISSFFAVVGGYNTILNGIQNAARQRLIVAFHTGLDAWLRIGFAFCIVVWISSSSAVIVAGYTISAILILSSQMYFLRKVIPKEVSYNFYNNQWFKDMGKYSLPFVTWGFIAGVQQNSARWALEYFQSTETVGYYAVLHQLGYAPIQIVSGMAMAFLMPIFFSRYGDGASKARNETVGNLINKFVILGTVLTISATLVSIFFHSAIFKLFVNSSYFSASYLLPWVVCSGGIFSVGVICATQIMGLLKPNELIPAAVGSSVIGISAAILGVYYFSLIGAISSILIHAIAYTFWVVMRLHKIKRNSK